MRCTQVGRPPDPRLPERRDRRALGWLSRRRSLALLILFAVVVACTGPRTGRSHDPEPVRLSRGAKLEPPAREVDRRPIRMVARDGTDFALTELRVRGTVEDPLAFTELLLEFENPEPRPLDATFEVRLPPHARVTRFAVEIAGSWREAEVVERKSGSLQPSLYEPAVPAVEADPHGDQRFVVSIPEVPGRGKRTLRLGYVETFPDADEPYRVRVAGLHDIPRFSAKVVVRSQPDPLLEVWAGNRLPEQLGMDEQGRRFLEIRRANWTATEDFVVPTSGLRRTGVRNGRKVAARITPLSHDHAAPIEGLTILFDTSASRAVGYRQRVEQLAGLIEALQPFTGNDIWLRLIAFDQGFEEVYEGPLGAIDRTPFDRLQARRALGASNLVSVLRDVRNNADHDVNRVILISDGMVTAGVSERSAVLDAVADLREVGIDRVDVIADHGRCDGWTLRDLVRKLPESGLVLDGEDNPRQLVRRLIRTVHDDVKISVPGARWSYPDVVHGLQSDDELLVFADIEALDGGVRVNVESEGKQTFVVPLVEVEEPLVGWALENARVELLISTLVEKAQGQPLAARKQLWRRIVSSSKQNRIVNDYTSLAMLGDRDEYAEARVDPAALPPILVAGTTGVEEHARAVPNALIEAEVPIARERLPVFPSESLGVDQLLLLAQEDVSAGPSGLSSAEADAVMAVGELEDRVVSDNATKKAPLPELEPLPDSPAAELARMLRARPVAGRRSGKPRTLPPERTPDDAYQGNLLTIMNLIGWGDVAEAKQVAWRWRSAEPTEVLAVIALGEALEANNEPSAAARAYGSIIDMYPDRADMRRFAGSRLEHLGSVGTRLAIDTYRRARQQRPDHPSSHRLLAFALVRAGSEERAFDVLAAGMRRDWSAAFSGAFVGVEKVLREDLGLVAAAWLAKEPHREAEIRSRLEQLGASFEREPSLRFVLTWETGANDVDLHVRDVLGSHAYYESRGLRTGGALYYDVTDGYGPEVFTILGEPTGYPYNLQVHYYARGPNGYGMGKVQIIEHDGHGGLAFDERPFVVMKDRAFVDLGDLTGPLAGAKRKRPASN